MIKHLMAVAVFAGGSVVASAAYAGSPYTADPTIAVRPTASHALGTSHTGEAWANEGYAATANDETFGTATPAAPASARARHGRGTAIWVGSGRPSVLLPRRRNDGRPLTLV